jgi:site-specific DNA-cytosine methylase
MKMKKYEKQYIVERVKTILKQIWEADEKGENFDYLKEELVELGYDLYKN